MNWTQHWSLSRAVLASAHQWHHLASALLRVGILIIPGRPHSKTNTHTIHIFSIQVEIETQWSSPTGAKESLYTCELVSVAQKKRSCPKLKGGTQMGIIFTRKIFKERAVFTYRGSDGRRMDGGKFLENIQCPEKLLRLVNGGTWILSSRNAEMRAFALRRVILHCVWVWRPPFLGEGLGGSKLYQHSATAQAREWRPMDALSLFTTLRHV